MMRDTPSYRRLLLVLCVAWLILNFVVLKGGRVLPWDAINQFYPTVYFNAHSLRAGIAPWWNPYIYGGYAQIGDPQGMLFSPLLMAWMLIPSNPGVVWFDWGVLLHMLLGGAAMLGLLRRHGANALGCLVGAIVFMAGGVAASRLEHTPIVIAYAYVPVVLLTLRHFLSSPGWGRGVLMGLAAGAMVAQLVQVTYLFVLVALAYGCMALVRQWPAYGRRQRWRFLGGMAAALVVVLALGLPQLLFSWAALQFSNRDVLPLSVASLGSLDLRTFLFFVYPNAFNGLRELLSSPIDPVQSFIYIGVLPALAMLFLARGWRRGGHRRTIVCFVLLAIIATIYMMGTNTPVYGWLYGRMPGLEHFRRPADGAYVLNFAFAFLAGIGASHINIQSQRERVGIAVGATVWLSLTVILMGHARGSQVVALLVAVLTVWMVRKTTNAWHASLWLMLLIVADYRAFNLGGRFNVSSNETARFLRHEAVRYLDSHMRGAASVPGERVATENIAPIWDNGGMLLGIRSTQGYNPLRYSLYESWYHPRESSLYRVEPSPHNAWPEMRLDDLLGVRYLAIGKREGEPDFIPPPDYIKLLSLPDVELWRNDGAYPHILNPTSARMVGLGEPVDPGEFIHTDFASTLWLTPRDGVDFDQSRQLAATCKGKVASTPAGATPTRMDIDTRAEADGWVVASELDHPGWEADVDGQPVSIHRANGMFRAVCVPAGAHRLRFTYHPWRMVTDAWERMSSKRS